MFEENESNQSAPFESDSRNEAYGDYLERAVRATDAGDKRQAVLFYLIAYDKATAGMQPDELLPTDHPAVEGLQNAWIMTVELEQRAMAEHVFELLDPYLTPEELEYCSFLLQRLALSKLREFGLSPQDVEAVSGMIHEDMMMRNPFGLEIKFTDHSPAPAQSQLQSQASDDSVLPAGDADLADSLRSGLDVMDALEKGAELIGAIADAIGVEEVGSEEIPAAGAVAESAADSVAAAIDAADAADTADSDVAEFSTAETAEGAEAPASPAVPSVPHAQAPEFPAIPRSMAEELANRIGALPRNAAAVGQSTGQITASKAPDSDRGNDGGEPVAGHRGYGDLVGFDESIAKMREMGYGMKHDEEFKHLLTELSENHGIEKLPSYGSMLFRAFAREDATRLMLATAYELDMPTVRMYMDENAQGVPILCVIASPDFRTKANVGFNGTVDSGVLVLEDVDLWAVPFQETPPEDQGQFPMQQLSHGVRKAIGLIRSAVYNPNVTVLASCSTESPMDAFMIDLLSPENVMDVELPTQDERRQMWEYLANKHHSLNPIDKDLLVRYSSNMSRYDIFYAAREAVEQAYKESIVRREYVSVSPEDMAEKLAAFQPLTSREYHQLEDAVVASFRGDIEELEKLLGSE